MLEPTKECGVTDTLPVFLVAVHGGAGDHPSSKSRVGEIKQALRLYVSRTHRSAPRDVLKVQCMHRGYHFAERPLVRPGCRHLIDQRS